MRQTLQPNVAGTFYPADARSLSRTLAALLADCGDDAPGPAPRALIAPHAGYVYSGPVAASAYKRLAPARDRIRRVVVLAPSHYVGFDGLARTTASAVATPLGEIPVETAAIDLIEPDRAVRHLEQAFAREHALEVQLPFLQHCLSDFELVPLVVGDASPDAVARVLETLWGGDETLIVVSSDLSHYLDYDTARRHDAATSAAIELLDSDTIGPHDACGCRPVNGLLRVAREHGLEAHTLDLRNSGDTAGTRDRVVGYGAYVFH